MRRRHDLVRAFIELWKVPWLISLHPIYSVMSFIGYDYKKNKELAESSQDLNTLDTYTMLADD